MAAMLAKPENRKIIRAVPQLWISTSYKRTSSSMPSRISAAAVIAGQHRLIAVQALRPRPARKQAYGMHICSGIPLRQLC
jgi:hypothetical protein